ncbi:hypothetical protein RGR602_CH03461 [Rhizobium gallicum bv. gallicum R602sp]|uniref:Uncharacterized protein n=1 Tax=Rhizobium gallicum bv. gallicum R602sp TaxID=1041138 RepID=A0A0B4X3S2_9HYPH|nr:hypothetical protein RGR602_CH03461 [Rhizobium gallicum bv. gallicum R602sp]
MLSLKAEQNALLARYAGGRSIDQSVGHLSKGFEGGFEFESERHENLISMRTVARAKN